MSAHTVHTDSSTSANKTFRGLEKIIYPSLSTWILAASLGVVHMCLTAFLNFSCGHGKSPNDDFQKRKKKACSSRLPPLFQALATEMGRTLACPSVSGFKISMWATFTNSQKLQFPRDGIEKQARVFLWPILSWLLTDDQMRHTEAIYPSCRHFCRHSLLKQREVASGIQRQSLKGQYVSCTIATTKLSHLYQEEATLSKHQ